MSIRERIHFLDVARGFAMLGIIIVNYFIIADSANRFATPADDPWHRSVLWFAEGKFYTLFSFLFGVGFMVFMERAERQISHPRMLFARRLMILLAFGLLHITLIWVGDILAFYAITGFFLLAFYKRRPKTLLIWFIVMMSIYSVMNPSLGADSAEDSLSSHSMDSSYLISIGERWADMGSIAATAPYMMLSMLSMFLLGMYFVQKGFFRDMETKKRIWNRIWGVSACGYLVTQAYLIMETTAGPVREAAIYEALAYLGQLGGLSGSMFYMSTLAMLFLHFAKLRNVLMMFGNVGRMSLTCYLLHSVIGTFLFLGYGFGAANGIQPAGVMAICFGVYAILLAISSLWLKRFKYGPMEWLWRRFTYGKMGRSPLSVGTITPKKTL